MTFFIEFRAHETFFGPHLSVVDKIVLRQCCKLLRDVIKVKGGARPVIFRTLKNRHYKLTKWLIDGGFSYTTVFWYNSPFQRVDDYEEFAAQTHLIEKCISSEDIMNHIVDSCNIKLLEWAINNNYYLVCGVTDAFISGETLIISQHINNGEILRHKLSTNSDAPTMFHSLLSIMGSDWKKGGKIMISG